MKFTGPTIVELRASYPPEKQRFDSGNLWGFLVMRRTSFYPTWLLVRLGLSANTVTALSFVVGLAGAALLVAAWRDALPLAGAVLVNLWNWLDYVDGNIARYKRSESSYGHLLDQTVGSVVVVLFGIAAGLSVYYDRGSVLAPFFRHLGIRRWLFVVLALSGVWSYTLRFLLRQSREQFANLFPRADVSSRRQSAVERGSVVFSSWVDHAISLLPPLLLVAAIMDGMAGFVILYALLFGLSAIIALVQFGALVQSHLPGKASNVRHGGNTALNPGPNSHREGHGRSQHD
ncbi:MAG: CDP-alcohol phosphatidyltransferase family protein [Chloroflexi bacterium]|nr:CDP-alcohol phosphatidyltransferase family protein [Chloroflexota bacterium]